MKLLEIVEFVMETRALTPDTEHQINNLLWSEALDSHDIEALSKLVDVLLDGSVKCVGYQSCHLGLFN